MTLSIFAQQIESLSREKKTFENNARLKLAGALKSFISETEVKPDEVSFLQDGFPVELDKLFVKNNEFKFQWIISVTHDAYTLEASVPVYAMQVWGGECEIQFGIGDHLGGGTMDDHLFMRKLIENLQTGINQAFP